MKKLKAQIKESQSYKNSDTEITHVILLKNQIAIMKALQKIMENTTFNDNINIFKPEHNDGEN